MGVTAVGRGRVKALRGLLRCCCCCCCAPAAGHQRESHTSPLAATPRPRAPKAHARNGCSVLQTTNITMAKAAAKKSPVKAAAPAAVKASPKKVAKAKSPKKTKSPKKGGKKAGAKKVTRPTPHPFPPFSFSLNRSRRPPRSKQEHTAHPITRVPRPPQYQ